MTIMDTMREARKWAKQAVRLHLPKCERPRRIHELVAPVLLKNTAFRHRSIVEERARSRSSMGLPEFSLDEIASNIFDLERFDALNPSFKKRVPGRTISAMTEEGNDEGKDSVPYSVNAVNTDVGDDEGTEYSDSENDESEDGTMTISALASRILAKDKRNRHPSGNRVKANGNQQKSSSQRQSRPVRRVAAQPVYSQNGGEQRSQSQSRGYSTTRGRSRSVDRRYLEEMGVERNACIRCGTPGHMGFQTEIGPLGGAPLTSTRCTNCNTGAHFFKHCPRPQKTATATASAVSPAKTEAKN